MSDLVHVIHSDIQFPLHDQRAVDLCMKITKYLKPDSITNIGDLANQDGPSRWAEGSADEVLNHLAPENEICQNYWASLRKSHPNAVLNYTLGNHDIRAFEYVNKKAPALRGLITPESLWHTNKNAVNVFPYEGAPQLKIGDIYLHHGSAISKHAGGSVQADMETWGVSLIRGHSHRMGSYFKTYELRNETLQGHEIGHMMDISKADYSHSHNWQQGMAYMIEDTDTGKCHVQLLPFVDYVCYVGTKRFSA